MTDAVERLVNLALFLADARRPVARHEIRAEVVGYDPDQDETAFCRMFERDKELLRDAGFAIETAEERYFLDADATYAAEIDLTPQEAAALRAVGTAMLADSAFPFAEDLRLALAKIAPDLVAPEVRASSALTDERAFEQGVLAARLSEAAQLRKTAAFSYTTAAGETASRDVEPYGLFLRDGRWYLVGRDREREAIRIFALQRMTGLRVNASAPRSPDFERPSDFDVGRFIMLPFQYGPPADEFEAVVSFAPEEEWRAPALTSGHGALEKTDDGSIVWRVGVRDPARLLWFVIENGPGIDVLSPPELADELREALGKVARAHG